MLAVFANMNIGDRHILPVYPFLLLLCGAFWEFARSHRRLLGLAVLALLFQVVDRLRPDVRNRRGERNTPLRPHT